MSRVASFRWQTFVLTSLATLGLLLAPPAAQAYQQELKALAGDLGKAVQKAGKKTVAVVDFTDLDGNFTALGRFLAEELSVAMAEDASGYEVIDRNHLASLMSEHKMTASGLINKLTAGKLGNFSGVDAVITGSLTDFGGDEVRMSVKVLDTSSARVLGARQTSIAQSATIKRLLDQDVEAIEVTEMGEKGSGKSAGGSGGSTGSANALKASSPKPKASEQEGPRLAESNNFVFELQSCQRSGQTVECSFRVANQGADQLLRIQGGSRLIDDLGDEHLADKGHIASAPERLRGYGWMDKTLLRDVPVRAGLTFEGVSPEATTIASFEINCQDQEDSFHVVFRKIPIVSKSIAGLGGSGEGESDSGGGIVGGIRNTIRDEAVDATRKGMKKLKSKLLGTKEEDGKDDGNHNLR